MALFNIEVTRLTGDGNDDRNAEIRRGFGTNFRHTVQDNRIFSATDQDHPAAFIYDANHIPLSVTGNFAFPAGSASADFCLRGVGPGPGGFQVTSRNFKAAPPGTTNFTAGPFSHQPAAGPPGCPFKVAGNWTWSILPASGGAAIATSAPIPLEIYFMFGDHALPFMWRDVHFLELIRLTFPDYQAVAGQPWANIETNVVFNLARGLWNHAYDFSGGVVAMWYNSLFRVGGNSEHLRAPSLNLESLLMRNPPNCNCYDLAALASVGLQSLGRRPNGQPVVDGVTVMAHTPWGYIPPGPLFGWESSVEAPNCNNPFWQNRFPTRPPPANNAASNVAQMDPDRTDFSSHCFVLFTDQTGVPRVVDICHANTNPAGGIFITGGALNVVDYRNVSIDREERTVEINWVNL